MNKIIMNEVIEGINFDKLESNIINIKKGESLVLYLNASYFRNVEFNLDEDAYLEINKIYDLADIWEEVTINLNGENSKVLYNFSTLAHTNQTFIININHNNKNTISNVYNHGVVINDSRLYFEVNSVVKKGYTNSMLNQESRIITMGDNYSEIKPNLLIDEYDVNARHAAIIGKFNKEDIFYLMSKGIPYEKVNELLIIGFLKNNIRR